MNFQKFQLKWKIVKIFYETHIASCLKQIIQLPHSPPHKILLHLWSKIFSWRYTVIYRHLFSKCFKKAVLARPEMVQCKCFFWHQTETCLLETLWSHKGFWLCRGSILFSMSSELRLVKWNVWGFFSETVL